MSDTRSVKPRESEAAPDGFRCLTVEEAEQLELICQSLRTRVMQSDGPGYLTNLVLQLEEIRRNLTGEDL